MKLKTIFFFLLFPAFCLTAMIRPAPGNTMPSGRMKAISVTVSGRILNDSTGKPVQHHLIIVRVPYFGYTATVYTDTSGNYTDTINNLPGLGDTLSVSIYDCHNILHIQSQPIQSYSIIINLFICESFDPQCVADFVTELDSSSVTPNKYRFLDLSKGSPDHWTWDFGDETTSTERNPVHIYSKEGHYKVCLSISRGGNLKAPCSDSACTILRTADYHSIGGHVFAGDHPINNPVSTGDTGIAYLYKLRNNYIIAYDTLTFTYLGYYSFPQLLSGHYFVKVALTPGSVNAQKYTPAYYINDLYWQQSQLLQIEDSSIFNFDVHLAKSNDSINGPGKISGKVRQHIPVSEIINLNLSEVLLLDSLKNLITYTLSDVSGNFSFNDLPYGDYMLFVESTGKFSKFTEFRISESYPSADTLLLDIYDHTVTSIPEIIKNNDVVAGLPFPNPSAGVISIPLTVSKPVDLITSVYSIQSVPLIESGAHYNPGSYYPATSLVGLSPGIYILIIRTPEGERICTDKIIRY